MVPVGGKPFLTKKYEGLMFWKWVGEYTRRKNHQAYFKFIRAVYRVNQYAQYANH